MASSRRPKIQYRYRVSPLDTAPLNAVSLEFRRHTRFPVFHLGLCSIVSQTPLVLKVAKYWLCRCQLVFLLSQWHALEMKQTHSLKPWTIFKRAYLPFIGERTWTSVLPIDLPCSMRPVSVAIFGSATLMNGSTNSVMRNAILRVKYELTRPECCNQYQNVDQNKN